MKILYLDLETYSSVDLKKAGVYAYVESPDFRVRLMGWALGEGPVRLARTHHEIEHELGALLRDPGVLKVAHNSQFDRVALSAALGLPVGEYLDPAQWEDTMALAARAGLPQSLKEAARALRVEQKDEAGTRLINMFSKPKKGGGMMLPEEAPERWEEFESYAVQDVVVLRAVHRKIPNTDGPQEREIWVADQRVNDRGLRADLDLARAALEQNRINQARAGQELSDLLGIENPNSVAQIRAALERDGAPLPDLRAETVSLALSEGSLGPEHRRALELRQEMALVAAKKYEAIVNATNSDGRLRGQFRYFGAHTGRWSGRGVQLQNLPRHQLDLGEQDLVAMGLASPGDEASIKRAQEEVRPALVEATILDLKLGLGAGAEDLKALVRAAFLGPMHVADYAAIEARVLAWVANERWAVNAFKEGRDIYVETAKRMGGLTRQQGKVAVLALGYQGGSNSLAHMGARGTLEELEWMKTQWRRANRRIVRLWRDLEDAFGNGGSAGKLRVQVRGKDRLLYLPSGRPIVYRNVNWDRWVVVLPDGRKARREGWRFDGGRGRADTYGGRLTENAVQAISRDLLAHAVLELMDLGADVVGHVHDEILVGADPSVSLDDVLQTMTRNPEWAKGLPLGAEGFTCTRYRKG